MNLIRITDREKWSKTDLNWGEVDDGKGTKLKCRKEERKAETYMRHGRRGTTREKTFSESKFSISVN